MSTLQEMRYKETTPDKTVKRIKEILKKHRIEVEENWTKKSSVNTYSLRLCIKGTNIGQNGKGMTKDFALASAYAELLERYQNGMLVFRQEKPTNELPFIYSHDEKNLSIDEIIEGKDSFTEKIFEENKEKYADKKELLEKILGKEKKISTLPYYSLKHKKILYIPHVLSCHVCWTNGMCAGNSAEEAMVEGISEILERYVSTQIVCKGLSLPEIPDAYLKKYPKVYDMLEKLRKNDKYLCRLLDCSLGGKYPVAGLIVIQKNTGKLGFKLGAHPDYGIAMERCFTEAAQGMDIYDYSQSCLFDFENKDLDKDENIREFLDSNACAIPYSIFSPEKTYLFSQMPDVSKLNNKEILKCLIAPILMDGYDILVRDVSTLGFPSFRIIIPGMSEMLHSKMAGGFSDFEEIEYLLKDLKRINLDNISRVIEIMELQINELGYNYLSMFINIKDVSLLHCENIGQGVKHFLAICYIMKGDYEKAEKLLENILFVAENLRLESAQINFLKATYYYASAMKSLKKHEKAMYYINLLFERKIVNIIDDNFKDRENILIKCYDIKQEDYVENDDKYYLPFMHTLRKLQKENTIDQSELRKVFE